MILLAAVKERLGAENVFAAHHLVSFEQDGSSVTAHFTDRETESIFRPGAAMS